MSKRTYAKVIIDLKKADFEKWYKTHFPKDPDCDSEYQRLHPKSK